MTSGDREDPGPPPERGIVVRPQGEGFYVRVSPTPVLPFRRWAPVMGGFTAIGVALGLWFGDGGVLTAQIVGFIVLFGALLFGFAVGAGFFPVEIVVDDTEVSWGGERFPMHLVGDCRAVDRTLELVAKDQRVLARIDGVPPAAARWVSLAIRASLP